jgi:MFS family permease
MTVVMKVDLVGPKRRGLALGINECAGYLALGFTAWLTGYLAAQYALRPQPFYLGIGVAIAGLLCSIFGAKETLEHARLESRLHYPAATLTGEPRAAQNGPPSLREIFTLASWKDRNLFSCSQAGMVNNLNDGMSWGIYPLFFASYGVGVAAIGMIKAVYPVAWSILQLVTGHLSDHWGRKRLIAAGMVVQASAIWLTVAIPVYWAWIVGALLQGFGTAMVYPTLLASISDVAHPKHRATIMGVYRFWRDLGYAVGALLSGIIADWLGMGTAIKVVAVLTFLSGLQVAIRMRETLNQRVIGGGSEARSEVRLS